MFFKKKSFAGICGRWAVRLPWLPYTVSGYAEIEVHIMVPTCLRSYIRIYTFTKVMDELYLNIYILVVFGVPYVSLNNLTTNETRFFKRFNEHDKHTVQSAAWECMRISFSCRLRTPEWNSDEGDGNKYRIYVGLSPL